MIQYNSTHQPAGKITISWRGNATPQVDPGVKVSTPADMTTLVKNTVKPQALPIPTCRNCTKWSFVHRKAVPATGSGSGVPASPKGCGSCKRMRRRGEISSFIKSIIHLRKFYTNSPIL